jgi:hypothetical protein
MPAFIPLENLKVITVLINRLTIGPAIADGNCFVIADQPLEITNAFAKGNLGRFLNMLARENQNSVLIPSLFHRPPLVIGKCI